MARIRTFKPEFFRSPDTARASHAARLLYLAMWSWADDHGRGETNIHGLLGFAFPDEDGIAAADFPRILAEIQCAWSVDFYKHRGRCYYAIPSWDTHQKNERRGSSKIPTPNDPDSTPDLRFYPNTEMRGISAQQRGNSATGTGEQGNRGTEEKECDARERPTVVAYPPLTGGMTPIPDDWQPSERERLMAPAKHIHNIDAAAEDFRNHALAQGRLTADWDAAFRQWISTDRARKADRERRAPGGPQTTTDRVNSWLDIANQAQAMNTHHDDPDQPKEIA